MRGQVEHLLAVATAASHRGRMARALHFAFTVLLQACMVSAATYFVSPAGSANASCTQADPCTFPVALSHAMPGDAVSAAVGRYLTPLYFTRGGLSDDARITVNGGTGVTVPNATFVNANFVTLDGVSVLNATGSGITMHTSHNAIIKNLELRNNENCEVEDAIRFCESISNSTWTTM